MRVVAGRLRDRRLAAPRGTLTRPTSDRVREALFAVLGDVTGARVLDLFAGSGALGIEALSRGAAHRGLRRTGDRQRRNRDARAFLRNARGAGHEYDLVFVDPPYRRAAALAGELSEALPPVLAPGARVVAESDRRAPLELALPLRDERRYGETLIRIHGP